MGSKYYGERNLANEKTGGGGSSSSSSSSRKGKNKSTCSDKPKQPQRGLGVAQLERIRLHSQLGSAAYIPNPLPTPNSYHPFINPIQEDVRLEPTYSSASSPYPLSFQQGAQNMMMGLGDSKRNVSHDDSQPNTNNIARWNAGNTISNPQFYQQPYITRNLINNLEAEELMEKKKNGRSSDSMGSGSQNSDSSGSQELDLELRLSL